MVKNNTKSGDDVGPKVAVGVGVMAALAAGAYYLYGTKEGAKKRVKIRGWVLKAKGEVMEKMEALKEVNEETYNAVISAVMKKYEGMKNMDQVEVAALVTDLKKHWKSIKSHLDTTHKAKGKSVAKKISKPKVVALNK